MIGQPHKLLRSLGWKFQKWPTRRGGFFLKWGPHSYRDGLVQYMLEWVPKHRKWCIQYGHDHQRNKCMWAFSSAWPRKTLSEALALIEAGLD